MYYVYVLQSVKNKSIYVGCTSDINKRLREHNEGKSFYTKKHLPWKIIYFEGYCDKYDVFSREKSLKLHAQGLRRIKERLRNSLQA